MTDPPIHPSELIHFDEEHKVELCHPGSQEMQYQQVVIMFSSIRRDDYVIRRAGLYICIECGTQFCHASGHMYCPKCGNETYSDLTPLSIEDTSNEENDLLFAPLDFGEGD